MRDLCALKEKDLYVVSGSLSRVMTGGHGCDSRYSGWSDILHLHANSSLQVGLFIARPDCKHDHQQYLCAPLLGIAGPSYGTEAGSFVRAGAILVSLIISVLIHESFPFLLNPASGYPLAQTLLPWSSTFPVALEAASEDCNAFSSVVKVLLTYKGSRLQ
jgi:hypothetical protein